MKTIADIKRVVAKAGGTVEEDEGRPRHALRRAKKQAGAWPVHGKQG